MMFSSCLILIWAICLFALSAALYRIRYSYGRVQCFVSFRYVSSSIILLYFWAVSAEKWVDRWWAGRYSNPQRYMSGRRYERVYLNIIYLNTFRFVFFSFVLRYKNENTCFIICSFRVRLCRVFARVSTSCIYRFEFPCRWERRY